MKESDGETEENPELLAEESKDIVPEKVFLMFMNISFNEESEKVLDVGEIKQSLSSFSFAKEDTEFKPPKKTKGGKEKICFYAVETLYLSLSTNQSRIL